MRKSILAIALLSTGCATPPVVQPVAYMPSPPPPGNDALFTPDKVVPGHLEYSPDRDTFAPVLTERAAYPTQREANNAYARATYQPGIYVITASDVVSGIDPAAVEESVQPASVHLFACKPGALDEQTGRVEEFRGPVVHCATDFSSSSGQRLFRATVNFAYDARAWTMQITHPPQTKARWLTVEHSSHDYSWWFPGRARYQ